MEEHSQYSLKKRSALIGFSGDGRAKQVTNKIAKGDHFNLFHI